MYLRIVMLPCLPSALLCIDLKVWGGGQYFSLSLQKIHLVVLVIQQIFKYSNIYIYFIHFFKIFSRLLMRTPLFSPLSVCLLLIGERTQASTAGAASHSPQTAAK